MARLLLPNEAGRGQGQIFDLNQGLCRRTFCLRLITGDGLFCKLGRAGVRRAANPKRALASCVAPLPHGPGLEASHSAALAAATGIQKKREVDLTISVVYSYFVPSLIVTSGE